MKVEAEHGELILNNTAGDMVIIPKDKRSKVLSLLDSNDYTGIDNLVSKLPVAADYAEGGGVYPTGPIKLTKSAEKAIEKNPLSVIANKETESQFANFNNRESNEAVTLSKSAEKAIQSNPAPAVQNSNEELTGSYFKVNETKGVTESVNKPQRIKDREEKQRRIGLLQQSGDYNLGAISGNVDRDYGPKVKKAWAEYENSQLQLPTEKLAAIDKPESIVDPIRGEQAITVPDAGIKDKDVSMSKENEERYLKENRISMLQDLGYDIGRVIEGDVDRTYGPKTKAAFKDYTKRVEAGELKPELDYYADKLKGDIKDPILNKIINEKLDIENTQMSFKESLVKKLPGARIFQGTTTEGTFYGDKHVKDKIVRNVDENGKIQANRPLINKSSIIPAPVRTLFKDIYGKIIHDTTELIQKTGIEIDDYEYTVVDESILPDREYNALMQASTDMLKRGWDSFNYKKLRKVGMEEGSIQDQPNWHNPMNVVGQVLGAAQFHIDESGNIYIQDMYNFVDAHKNKSWKALHKERSMDFFKDYKKASYSVGRNLGSKFGSTDDEGFPVSMFVGHIDDHDLTEKQKKRIIKKLKAKSKRSKSNFKNK